MQTFHVRPAMSTRAFVSISAVALLALSLSAGVASADGGRGDHGPAQSTFTKWITTYPVMAGVVGGAVGDGTYAGEILKYTPGTTTVIEALYHFTGSQHSFTALMHIEQTGTHAVLVGAVTDGWLKGNLAVGEYAVVTPCAQAPSNTCFQGTLNILMGSGAGA